MNEKTEVFGLAIDVVDLPGAVDAVLALVAARQNKTAALIVTPNLDHVVRLRTDDAFRRAYRDADLVLADGFPLVLASRLGARQLPGRVTGSDLVLPLCAAAAAGGKTVFVLGTSLTILATAARRLVQTYPSLQIVGVFAPGMGFNRDHPDTAVAVQFINEVEPDILFLALGSPRQELWAAALRPQLRVGTVVCVGAAFDFLADRPRRAPVMLQNLHLEWLWRMALNPGKLARRYARGLVELPGLLLDEWRRSALPAASSGAK